MFGLKSSSMPTKTTWICCYNFPYSQCVPTHAQAHDTHNAHTHTQTNSIMYTFCTHTYIQTHSHTQIYTCTNTDVDSGSRSGKQKKMDGVIILFLIKNCIPEPKKMKLIL